MSYKGTPSFAETTPSTPTPTTSAGTETPARGTASHGSVMPETASSHRRAWNNPNGLAPAGPQGHESLAKERAGASFDVNELSVLLHGQDSLDADREMLDIVSNDPVFDKSTWYSQGREERFAGAMARGRHMVEVARKRGWDDATIHRCMMLIDEPGPYVLHFHMFKPTLHGQCSDEQKEKWIPLAESMRIIGCYSQTELGHGSNVQGLETTATYDPATQEFEIHSPSLTASKWWAGGLGRTATHAIVVARLILAGKDHGTHTFIVQIRSLEDHVPLPGITIGDIGSKYGYNAVDNGFMMFDKVRIPRDQMLMRYARVEADGTYVRPPSSKLSYGTMVFVRANIVSNSARNLARASTIATRYSAVRRQFVNQEASKNDVLVAQAKSASKPIVVETAVLDYPMQSHRILTRIAQSYALHFSGKAMMTLYKKLQVDLAAGNIAGLPEVHATSSGLKSMTTDLASAAMEDLRRSCGGHGFLKNSGFPEFIGDYLPNVTYEGDNHMLTQQTTRYLLKAFTALAKATKVPKPENLTQSTRYLLAATQPSSRDQKWSPTTVDQVLEPAALLAAFSHRAGSMVSELARDIADGTQTFTQAQVDIHAISRAHCQLVIVENFADALAPNGVASSVSPALRIVLTRLLALYALDVMQQDIGSFAPYVDVRVHGKLVKQGARRLLTELRSDAVPLVDAWAFSDYLLHSTLGRYDGKVYEALVEEAGKEPLNNGKNFIVHQDYATTYGPLIKAKL
ncbi:hypothetical protein HKX48_000072 [Thoreauomyces humboldtii]|nr:hypothetical protein HKX48_000072 [Thoreauomyces humboldtii]